MTAAQVFQSPTAIRATPVRQPEWTDIERPFPAFALSIPEAAGVPSSDAIRRHAEGGGRNTSQRTASRTALHPICRSKFTGKAARLTASPRRRLRSPERRPRSDRLRSGPPRSR
jgi:hypothetical protein